MGDRPPEFKPTYEPARSYLVKGELLNALVRRLHAGRLIAGEGIKEVETPSGTVWSVGEVEEATLDALEAYVYGDKVRVAPGYIRNPYTIPTIGGTAIDDATPPELTPASGTSYLYLKLTFDPVTVELDSGFYAMGFAIDTIDAAEFVLDASLAPSGATDPVIDSSDGSITTAGVAFVLWAEVENDGGLVSIVYGSGTGHASLLFHPPDQLVVFQS